MSIYGLVNKNDAACRLSMEHHTALKVLLGYSCTPKFQISRKILISFMCLAGYTWKSPVPEQNRHPTNESVVQMLWGWRWRGT